jgi:hypothetical protein
MRLFTALVLGLGSSSAWAFVIPPMVVHSKARLWSLKAVPLELEGVLDPSRCVEIGSQLEYLPAYIVLLLLSLHRTGRGM